MTFKAKAIRNDHPIGGFMDSFDADRGFPKISDEGFNSQQDGYGPGLDNSPPVDQQNDTPDGGYSCSNCAPQPGPAGGWQDSQTGNATLPTSAEEARKRAAQYFPISTVCDP